VCGCLYSRPVPNVTARTRIGMANVSIKLGIHHGFRTVKELLRLTYNVFVILAMYVDIHLKFHTKNLNRNLGNLNLFRLRTIILLVVLYGCETW